MRKISLLVFPTLLVLLLVVVPHTSSKKRAISNLQTPPAAAVAASTPGKLKTQVPLDSNTWMAVYDRSIVNVQCPGGDPGDACAVNPLKGPITFLSNNIPAMGTRCLYPPNPLFSAAGTFSVTVPAGPFIGTLVPDPTLPGQNDFQFQTPAQFTSSATLSANFVIPYPSFVRITYDSSGCGATDEFSTFVNGPSGFSRDGVSNCSANSIGASPFTFGGLFPPGGPPHLFVEVGLSAGEFPGTGVDAFVQTFYKVVQVVPHLTLTPSSLVFTANPNAPAQTVKLTNNGPGSADFNAMGEVDPSVGSAWLRVSPASGTLGVGESIDLQVAVSTADLGGGTYSGHVAVSGGDVPETVSVNLTVSGSQVGRADAPAAKSRPTQLVATAAPTVTNLEQKIVILGAQIKLDITGSDFSCDSIPEFLNVDGTVDTKLFVSDVEYVNKGHLQAEVLAFHDAAIGVRSLRVRRGNVSGVPLAQALNVVGLTMKISQGVVNKDAKVPDLSDRIANHATVVRFTVQSTSSVGLNNGLSGTLFVFQNGQQIPGSPRSAFFPQPNLSIGEPILSDTLIPKAGGYTFHERFGLRDSLNFYFGVSDLRVLIPQGQFSFALAVDPSIPASNSPVLDGSLTHDQVLSHHEFAFFEDQNIYNFVTTKPLRILAIADPRLSRTDTQALFNQHKVSLEFLKAAYPVDGSQVVMHPLIVSKDWLDLDYFKTHAFAAESILLHLQYILYRINALTQPDQRYDRVVLLLRSIDMRRDFPSYAGVSKFSASIVGELGGTIAHEIGHTFGLDDTYSGGILYIPGYFSRFGPNPRRSDATPAGNRVEDGAEDLTPVRKGAIDLLGASASVDNGGSITYGMHYQKIDFMGSASTDEWVDFVDWNYLSTKLSLTQSGLNTRTATLADADLITLQGFANVDGTLSGLTLRRGAVIPAPPILDTGEYNLDLSDKSGQVLSSVSFGVDFALADIGLVTGSPLSVSTPFVLGATNVRIRKSGTILFSRALPASQPSVQVTSPAGGETLSGPFAINWTSSDPDGLPLTYDVFYMRGGVDPVPIATNLTTTSFLWNDPTENGGGEGGQIVVVASDGVNEGSATSQAFRVSKRSPAVTLLSPNDGLAVPAGAQVVLSGAGYDPEDGILPDSDLSFHSSLDGDLGTGGTVARLLSPGVHTITLQAVDSDGNKASSSITVTVGAASSVPVITNLSPASAPANSTVVLSGQNFDPNGSVVFFGSVNAPVISASSSQLSVQVPTGLPLGDTLITVKSHGLTSNQTPFTITNSKPLLLDVTPNSAPSGAVVYIRGAEFDPDAFGNTVSFGNAAASVLGAGVNDLLVAVPAGVLGTVNLTVTTAQGASNSLPFTVMKDGSSQPVVINSISPLSGSPGATITITGTGFSSVAGRNVVSFGPAPAVATIATDNSIQVTVPPDAAPGLANVLVAVNGYPSNPLYFTVTSPTTNPLDDALFFVRQHYLDFLEREPDPGGLAYWTGQITQCRSEPTCLHNKRIDVSNAFFFELEYQQTAAYVFRLYRAAFGNNQPFPNSENSNPTEAEKLPSFAVFSQDRSLVVGSSSLAQSQLDLANAFVQRAQFLAKYPASQPLGEFVDALLATVQRADGVDLGSQRAALIALGSRGAVLYRIADDNLQTNPINNRSFIDAEYNRAFVASQYFGYLRRDADIGGFLFWLGQVNSGPLRDAAKQHAMVCSFITSAEYQLRFSPLVTHSNAECPQ